MTSNVLENLSKMVRKSFQNTSKIDFEGALEAAWEPPLCGGDPKTSFWSILAPLWDPFGDQFWLILESFFDDLLICLPDDIFGNLESIWVLFWRPFGVRFWKLV